jgi:hypothetical protein
MNTFEKGNAFRTILPLFVGDLPRFCCPIMLLSIRCSAAPPRTRLGDNGIPIQATKDSISSSQGRHPITSKVETLRSASMSTKPFPVIVHPFTSPTPGSCAYERGSSSRNALVYIGGLTSGPHSSSCLEPLIQSLLHDHKLSYSFWEFRMRSSYTGFGYSSLAYDVADLSALVAYLRSLGKEKVVLLGSSTGTLSTIRETNLLIEDRMSGDHEIHQPQTKHPRGRRIHHARTDI